ncbi:hypothetical protein BDP55DRAFT_740675 [Colletotrichum godetiae]|uniref:Uncharacterized protein n=1 Tax=Colletotrichum godetiae TaxID=1209918 RepID=A0AAJ0AR65_9PEZI|nr:uncharacterized protein BDP55DRAFT_740675 [Colletotrichum godetiae]KAK1687421.1 hypothetical protein BDP55DRAFT_740675 [Colletotrichum godetiae]
MPMPMSFAPLSLSAPCPSDTGAVCTAGRGRARTMSMKGSLAEGQRNACVQGKAEKRAEVPGMWPAVAVSKHSSKPIARNSRIWCGAKTQAERTEPVRARVEPDGVGSGPGCVISRLGCGPLDIGPRALGLCSAPVCRTTWIRPERAWRRDGETLQTWKSFFRTTMPRFDKWSRFGCPLAGARNPWRHYSSCVLRTFLRMCAVPHLWVGGDVRITKTKLLVGNGYFENWKSSRSSSALTSMFLLRVSPLFPSPVGAEREDPEEP